MPRRQALAKCVMMINLQGRTYGAALGALDIGRNTGILRAIATSGARLALLIGWVGRIEPKHIGVVLPPKSVWPASN
jgi:hypothetical protein